MNAAEPRRAAKGTQRNGRGAGRARLQWSQKARRGMGEFRPQSRSGRGATQKWTVAGAQEVWRRGGQGAAFGEGASRSPWLSRRSHPSRWSRSRLGPAAGAFRNTACLASRYAVFGVEVRRVSFCPSAGGGALCVGQRALCACERCAESPKKLLKTHLSRILSGIRERVWWMD